MCGEYRITDKMFIMIVPDGCVNLRRGLLCLFFVPRKEARESLIDQYNFGEYARLILEDNDPSIFYYTHV